MEKLNKDVSPQGYGNASGSGDPELSGNGDPFANQDFDCEDFFDTSTGFWNRFPKGIKACGVGCGVGYDNGNGYGFGDDMAYSDEYGPCWSYGDSSGKGDGGGHGYGTAKGRGEDGGHVVQSKTFETYVKMTDTAKEIYNRIQNLKNEGRIITQIRVNKKTYKDIMNEIVILDENLAFDEYPLYIRDSFKIKFIVETL